MANMSFTPQPFNPGHGGPRPKRTPPARRMAAQARTSEQESALAVQYRCSVHAIAYYMVKGEKATCPACDLEHQLAETKAALREAVNKNERLHDENHKMRVQVDVVQAMREALETIGQDDLMFLKTVLYQWKIDRSIMLRVTHRMKAGRKQHPNGFMALPRGAEPYAYVCTSLGGMAMSEYMEEAINTTGSAQAMILLARAMHKHLPGASE